MRIISKFHCIVGLSFLSSGVGFSATIVATGVTSTAVQSAINAAVDGDTVIIPAGTARWTTGLTCGKAINLIGSGATNTVIISDVTPAGGLLEFDTEAGKSYRLADITFKAGSVGTYWSGHINISGSTTDFRVTGCVFTNFNQWTLWIDNSAVGVIDHCKFYLQNGGIQVTHGDWRGASYGDGSWADASNLGTTNTLVVEDCQFVSVDGNVLPAIDSVSGARWTFRYNLCTNIVLRAHGTDSGGRRRSTRAIEIYENVLFKTSSPNWANCLELRGGTGVMWNNRASRYNTMAGLKNFRQNQEYSPWGEANGSGAYDGNTLSDGYPCIDQVGRGAGDLLSGASPTPAAWPKQVLDPWYAWGNTIDGAPNNGGSGYSTIQLNRDYYTGIQKPGYVPLVYPHPRVTADSGAANPGALKLSAATYSVQENAAAVAVTIQRINGFAGTVSVRCATSNGTARAGTDFSAVTSTLNWADGDSQSKTVQIPLINNSVEDGNRSFSMTLSNPVGGASLSSPIVASVTINDDDDDTAPSILDISHGIPGSTMATIVLTTDEPADSAIDYGLTTSLGNLVSTATLKVNHSLSLANLAASTRYYYRVRSSDSAGNEAVSAISNLTTATPSSVRTFIVDKDHANAANNPANGSESNPWSTIQYALTQIRGGDTILIKESAVPYDSTGSIIITGPSGTVQSPTTFKAYPGHQPKIRGSGNSGRIALDGTSYWLVEDLDIANHNHIFAVRNNAAFVTVRNCTLHDSGGQIVHVYGGSHDIVFENNILYNGGSISSANGEAFYVGTHGGNDFTHNVTIRGNHISTMTSDGIEFKHDTHNCIAEYNTLTNCVLGNQFGVRTIEVKETVNYQSNPNHIIRGNLIQSHPQYGSAIRVETGAQVYNNIIYNVASPSYAIAIGNTGGDSWTRYVYHNTFDIPSSRAISNGGGTLNMANNIGPATGNNLAFNSAYFVDAASRNYRLAAGSNPIDAGGSVPFVLAEDFDRMPRTAPFDIGAHEYSSGGGEPLPGLSWESTDGLILQPFVITGNYVSQAQATTVEDGGQAIYNFVIPRDGDYVVWASVNAPTHGANSLYVNIDGPVVHPTMVWDMPLFEGFTNRVVSWRGSGTDVSNEFNPKIFTLSAGLHQLIISGREANTQFGRITVAEAGLRPGAPANLEAVRLE